MNKFSKKLRLSTKSDIDLVFAAPKKISARNFLLLYRHNCLANPRLGMLVAKKKIPKAHDRNRVKRMVREAFRTFKSLPNVDIVFLAKDGLGKLDKTELHQNLQQTLSKLRTYDSIC